MTIDEAIEYVRRPRTGYEGREPSPGELFVAEIDRLRVRVAELEAELMGKL